MAVWWAGPRPADACGPASAASPRSPDDDLGAPEGRGAEKGAMVKGVMVRLMVMGRRRYGNIIATEVEKQWQQQGILAGAITMSNRTCQGQRSKMS